MYIAVMMYEKVADKPVGMPDSWPAEVKELGDSQESPGPHWVIMKATDLAAYKAARQDQYNKWKSEQIVEEPPTEPEE